MHHKRDTLRELLWNATETLFDSVFKCVKKFELKDALKFKAWGHEGKLKFYCDAAEYSKLVNLSIS